MSEEAGKPRARLREISWRDGLMVGVPAVVIIAGAFAFTGKLVQTAPPTHIRMISGSTGSSYRTLADRYKKIIEAHGVKVDVVPSEGAFDNLEKLANPKDDIDVGFVQGGLADGVDISHLVSLGTVFTQPLMVYYRLPKPIERLSELKGKRVAIGAEGSGTHALALKLLKANDMDDKTTTLVPEHGEDAARALVDGKIDAAFLMGDSATPEVMRGLRGDPGVRLMSFRQAEGYVRRLKFLSHMTLPEGAMDLGKNYPSEDVSLIGPAVELIARRSIHPAISDMLISAAREIHSGPGMYRKAGEYPAPLEHDFPVSNDAIRYYKTGQQTLYKMLPFWLASLVDRVLVVVLPLLVILLPMSRAVPTIYRWRVRSRIYRWYGALMAIEREMARARTDDERRDITRRLDEIQHSVAELKTPLSFADQLYVLRDHVAHVRGRLDEKPAAT
jgi:TRAP transporter TAXI family solute receptor